MLSGAEMYSKVVVEINGCIAIIREYFNNTYGEHKECIERHVTFRLD